MKSYRLKRRSMTNSLPVVVIRPSRGWIPINVRDLWIYRELMYFLTWREIKVRYKQTLLGAAWAIIQPFFILLAVPLAMIGVFVAFVIADFAFDSSAYIGVILLGGIVVNNSILLVDHIKLKRKKGLSVLESVLKGAKERIRPILLTTGTTVFGMLPLLLLQTEVEKQKIWSSLALSTVGGLISSTFFILVVIPIFYYYGNRLKEWSQSQWIRQIGFWKNLKGKEE